MRTYVYCSYKFSPAGFKMGTIEHDAARKNFYIPTKTGLDNFVVTAFERGLISKMYGRLPDGGKYIFLVKNLKQNDIDDPNEGTIDFHMNFAFEFDNFSDYNNFCGNFNALIGDGVAAAECAKFVVPDRNVETFALKIDAAKFNSFVDKMLRPSDGGQVDKKIFVEVISANLDGSELRKLFGCDFGKTSDAKKFCYPAPSEPVAKKKTSTSAW